jgi:hypothetical protein
MAAENRPDKIEVLLQYVHAATTASKRSRLILLVLVVASVIAFFASWNIRPGGWIRSRLRVQEDVLRWWPDVKTGNQPALITDDLRSRFDQARQFYLTQTTTGDSIDLSRLSYEVQALREIRVKDLHMIRMPFFGVVFDLNDLTLIAGLAFSIILMWLSFALSSELRDMRTTFRKAQEAGSLGLAYDLLLVQQVLIVPPDLWSPRGTRVKRAVIWIHSIMPQGLIFLPLFVQAVIIWRHTQTMEIGESISPASAQLGLIIGISALMGFIIPFTLACTYLTRATLREWRKYGEQVERLRARAIGNLSDDPALFPRP